MFDICILDDELKDAQKTKQMVERYADLREIEINRIDLYQEGTTLLQAKKQYDILFLDIEVGKENGIAIAKVMREYAPDMLIIVITSYLKYSMEGYKIQAARYLLKPVPQALLYSELDEVLANYDKGSYLIANDGTKTQRIKKSDVYYIESYGRKVSIHTRSGAFSDKASIGVWTDQLNEMFIECYKGILVHVRWILSIDKETLTLENRQILPLARRRSELVRKAWLHYQEDSL